MPTIRIRNIGAIVDSGVVEVKPMTLVVGRQSSGKSTFMKVLCMCQWVEKKMMTGDPDFFSSMTHNGRFLRELKSFFRLDDSFFSAESSIEYDGVLVGIEFSGGDKRTRNAKIVKKPGFKGGRFNTKLCFIPAERNVATVMPNFDKKYRSTDLDIIFNYLLEYQEARTAYTKGNRLSMPFDCDVSFYYDETSDEDHIALGRRGDMPAVFASSGLQSGIPLTMLVDYASRLVGKQPDKSVSDISSLVKRLMGSKASGGVSLGAVAKDFADIRRYRSVRFFIEEPELSLFPASQFEMVKFIVEAISRTARLDGDAMLPSGAVMTTHSPYVLTSLSHLLKVSVAKEQGVDFKASTLPSDSFSAYCINADGRFEYIVDNEYHFIKGDYLDSLSDTLQDEDAKIIDKLYGGTEAHQ